jgi:hypothetical protein
MSCSATSSLGKSRRLSVDRDTLNAVPTTADQTDSDGGQQERHYL